MIRHYLKIALRNLSRNKTYSFINIFGLTLSWWVFVIAGALAYCCIGHSRLKALNAAVTNPIKSLMTE